MWYWQRTYMYQSCIPIDVFLVFIKIHSGVSSYLFKHQSYHFCSNLVYYLYICNK